MIKFSPVLSAITEEKITDEKKCEIISWTMNKANKPVTKDHVIRQMNHAKKSGESKYYLSNSWFQTQNWLLQNQDKLTKAEETHLLKVIHSGL